MSVLRILLGISAGIVVIATLFVIGLKHTAVAATLILLGIAGFVGWTLFRALKTGTIVVRNCTYHRKRSPFTYWFNFCFLAIVTLFLISGCVYSLVTR